MSAAHTPGPWLLTVERSNCSGVNITFRIDTPTAISLCSGQSQEHIAMTNSSAVLEDECRANGELIAAAPELLEALQALEREADRSLDYRPEFRRAISNAHAAICAATGSAS